MDHILFEVKYKTIRYRSNNFEGFGVLIKQVNRRLKFYIETNIPTYILVYEKYSSQFYGQYLDKLQNNIYIDVGNTRIYDFSQFKIIDCS